MTDGYCFSIPQLSLFFRISWSERCCMEFLTEEGGQFIEVRLGSGEGCFHKYGDIRLLFLTEIIWPQFRNSQSSAW